MKITFLGTDTCIPSVGNDTASYLINDELLIDVGWNVTGNLRQIGVEVSSVRHLLFTHMHHDHMISFPSLIFHWTQLPPGRDVSPLTIYGPNETLERAFEGVLAFLQADRFWPNLKKPTLVPLKTQDEFETPTLRISCIPSDHAVPGRCYRIVDKRDGKVLCMSGDTAYGPTLAPFFKDCDLLIHEFSGGLSDVHGLPSKHSSAIDAATVAKEANAKKLAIVHGPLHVREKCLEAVAEIYSGECVRPEPCMSIEI